MREELLSRGYDPEFVENLIKERLLIKNGMIVQLCGGCNATCTTGISKVFHSPPHKILQELRRY
jgi:hypothetical protein